MRGITLEKLDHTGGMTNQTFMGKVLPVFSLGLLMTGAGAFVG